MIGYLGFLRRGQFIGERATRGGGPPVQVGPKRGQGGGASGWRLGPVGAPVGVLLAPSSFHIGNNSRKFSAQSKKLLRTTFLKQKDSKKQELALGILLIG